MARLLIRNGIVIDPSQRINSQMDVLIEDGIIIKVAEGISDHTDRVLEARGLTVIPGLVDMHVHLRDPGQTHKEDIFTGCNAAISGGVTTVLCMPNTNPVIDNQEIIEYVKRTASSARARVNICASITSGLKGKELADFDMYKEAGVKAVSDDGRPVENSEMMLEAMKKAKQAGLTIISHCEDLDIISGGIMHKGEVSEQLNVKGMDRLSEDSITEREIALAKENDLSIHIAHVSTKGAVSAIRMAKLEGVKVTCETCPHYFVYTHDKLKSRDADYRMNPPLREHEDVDAIIAGIQDGTIDCIVTDHAPHSREEKQNFETAPNGIVGLETSLAAGIKFLVDTGKISMKKLIELMSYNPANILGLDVGTLKVGSAADIALVDTNLEWTVLPERMNSKSRNTAFKFEKLKGKVKYTFLNGELVYVNR